MLILRAITLLAVLLCISSHALAAEPKTEEERNVAHAAHLKASFAICASIDPNFQAATSKMQAQMFGMPDFARLAKAVDFEMRYQESLSLAAKSSREDLIKACKYYVDMGKTVQEALPN